MTDIKISDDYIKLEQALKLAGIFTTGSDAKYAIKEGKIKVNKETELRRGRKLRPLDIFTYENYDYRIIGT